jgi:hypothetical protein
LKKKGVNAQHHEIRGRILIPVRQLADWAKVTDIPKMFRVNDFHPM